MPNGIFAALGFPLFASHTCDSREDGTTTADGGKGSRLDAMIDGRLPDVKGKHWEATPKVYFSHGKGSGDSKE